MPEPTTFSTTTRRIAPWRARWKLRDIIGILDEMGGWPGDVARLQFGDHTIAVLKHPDLVQQLLVTEASRTQKGRTLERSRFFEFLGNGLLNSSGDAHRRQRRLLLPAFHRSRLAGYGQAMQEATAAMTAGWGDGEVHDIVGDLSELTLAIIGRTLFSSDIQDSAVVICRSFQRLSADFNRMAFPGAGLISKLPLPAVRRIEQARTELDTVVRGLIQDRRRRGGDSGDLLSMILLAEDAENPGEHLSDEEVRDQVMTMFFAGHEASTNALVWTLLLVARHPEVAAALEEEIGRVLGDRPAGFADVPALVFTEQVVRESMRLYPPVVALGRRPTVDLRFGDCDVPKDALVVVSQWLIHRDARWYPDPESFRPERWTGPFKADLPRYAYFPFGGGARSCLGENYAWMEFVIVLATIARHWRLEETPESRAVRPELRITLHPDRPVPLRLHRRQKT